MPTPNFAVRHLSVYSSEELLDLRLAISYAYEQFKKHDIHAPSLDYWAYRITDAQKEARIREKQEQFLGI